MLQEYIEKWKKEYSIEQATITASYKWINSHTLGLTHHKNDVNGRYNTIDITDVFENHSIASIAVLWHEFCHAEVWIKEGVSDGHSNRWVGRCWRKPILYLLDLIYTKILFEICKHKH